jgi:hypothetical protein
MIAGAVESEINSGDCINSDSHESRINTNNMITQEVDCINSDNYESFKIPL